MPNPVNDANDIAVELGKLGFEVIKGVDVSGDQMKRLIKAFGVKLNANRGVGLFYYAGHGIQSQGHNYLIPVDADIRTEETLEFDAVDVNRVLAEMDAANNGTNIVILDACRNNPFARSWRSTNQGLAQINAPEGTLVAYATSPGKTASDGNGRNGAYTGELLRQMRVAGLPIETVFKAVRTGVKAQTNNEQVPWESSSLTGDFYFTPASGQPAAPAPVVAENPPPTPLNPAKTLSDEEVERKLQRVQEYSKSNLIEAAIREGEEILAARPGEPRVSFLLGTILMVKGSERTAFSHFKNVYRQVGKVALPLYRHRYFNKDGMEGGFILLTPEGISLEFGDESFAAPYAKITQIEMNADRYESKRLYIKGEFTNKSGKAGKKDFNLYAPKTEAKAMMEMGNSKEPVCKDCELWVTEMIEFITNCRLRDLKPNK